jgi:uroporphyrinogen-III decarboxylase
VTSRERVLRAFDHEEPDRVPAWCGAAPEFWAKAKDELGLDDEALRVRFHDDFRRVFSRYAGPEAGSPVDQLSEDSVYRTPFGIERRGIGYGQPRSHPLAEASLHDLARYPWPDPDWIDVSRVRSEALQFEGQYAILGGEWAPYWHDAIDLVGMENFYYRLYDDPGFVDALLTHIVDFYFEVSRRTFEAAADALDIFFIGNDFGSQMGPLVGEELFRRFLLPPLKRLIDLGHRYDLKVMLHCCGGFAPLIPAMIEAGLDGLHAVQPSCVGMDLASLKHEFGEKILFNGCVDSHHVLIKGNPQLVRQKTREVIDTMKSGGGFVAGASHDTILEETPLENVLAMFDTIAEYGRY